MSLSPPIKGQDIELLVMQGTEIVRTFTAIQSFKLNFDFELIEEGYLSMTANEYDEVFKGIKGDMTVQLRDKLVFAFIKDVLAKAQRRVAGQTFSFKAKFNFANGQTVRLLLPDIHFGAIPLDFGNRTSHAHAQIDFACSGAVFIGV